jgi:oligopeptide transport system substrate-binding protein
METTFSRRHALATALGFAAASATTTTFAARAPHPAGPRVTAFLQSDGTSIDGMPLVIEGPRTRPEPQPSGEQSLRLAGPVEEPRTLDPAFTTDVSTSFLCRQIFRGLVVFDGDLNPIPELAHRVEISADGLTYTFALADGATYHDGRAITSDDVIYSLTRALSPFTPGIGATNGVTFLTDIVGADAVLSGESETLAGLAAPDDRTVVVTLARPRATFLMKLASAPASIVDRNDVDRGDGWWRTANGTGPFTIAEWREREMLTLVANGGFVNSRPSLDRVDIIVGPQAGAELNLYQAGEVDLAGIPSNSVDRMRAPESGFAAQVRELPMFATEYIALRTDIEPLDDPHIRRALILAFDREKLAPVMFDGKVIQASGIIPDGMLGKERWEADNAPYDVDAALAEIAASRYGDAANTPPIELFSFGSSTVAAVASTVSDATGLTVEAVTVQWNDFIDLLPQGRVMSYSWTWVADFPDPETFLDPLFASWGGQNFVGYSNPAFDDLLLEAAKRPVAEERIPFYEQAQQLLLDDAVLMPGTHPRQYVVVRPELQGLEITPAGILGLETIWMAR